MDTTNFPDLSQLLIAFGRVVPALIAMMQYVIATVGVVLVANAFLHFWAASDNSSVKFLSGKTNYSYATASTSLFVGVLLLGLSDLHLMGMASRSLTGNYMTEPINSSALSYGTGDAFSERAQQATQALLSIMQAVGFFAVARGIYALHDIGTGRSNFGYGGVAAFIIGGLCCWNFQWFVQTLENTLGFSFFGLFTPFV